MAVVLLWRPEGLFKARHDAMQRDLRAACRCSSLLASRCSRCSRWSPAPFYIDLVTKIMILAIFALSLELLVGNTGLVSLGHAAFFGIGAYADGAGSRRRRAGLAAAGCCRLRCGARRGYALVVGALSLRTAGVYFIMVTLAFAQMAYFVFHDTPLGGGTDGIYLERRARRARRPALLDLGQRAARSTTSCSLRSLVAVRLARAAAALALRPRAGGHPRQRAAHARGGFPTYPLQARRLRDRRRARRAGRLPVRGRRTATSTPSCWPGTIGRRCC